MNASTEAAHSEQMYRLMLDHAVDAFIAIDASGSIVEWSRQAEKMFGWSRDEVIGMNVADTVIPERYRAMHERGLARFLATGESTILDRRVELQARRQNGSEMVVELAITPFEIDGRRFFSASIKDISRRRALEEEIRKQTDIMRSILDGMGDGVVVADTDGRIMLANPVAQRLLNLRPIEIDPGQPFPVRLYQADGVTLYQEGERPMSRALRGDSVNGQIALVYPTGMQQGLWVSAYARPLRDAKGAIVGGVVVIHDITELRRSQEDYRLLVAASTEHAIMMIDPQGVILKWNTGAEKMIGMSQSEAIGQHVSSLFTPEDRNSGEPLRELDEARRNGRSADDRWHVRRDGSRFWASGVVTPLWDEDGGLRGYVKIMRDQTAQRLAEEQTQFLASHDSLTGLPNRVSFSSQLHQALARYERNRVPFAVLLLDLDKFKNINDSYGHDVGDLLLQEVALRIQSSLRETDFVARLGGDEFVVIQTDVSQPAAAEVLARKLIAELGQLYLLEGKEIATGTSIGISTYPIDASGSVEIVKCADLALYRAKSAGRGVFRFYTPELFSEHDWKKNRKDALRNALANHEFALYYQPQIDLANWRIATAEALLRWKTGGMEVMLPEDFLDIAEETGMMVEIGTWALRQACLQMKAWQDKGMHDLRISLNCSACQFADPQFVQSVAPVLEECGVAPSNLELEITESMLSQHPEIKDVLVQLRASGVRITIDNYGTGSTALLDLKEFEVDSLKIDKAFVQHLPYRRKDAAITAAIISLARNLGIDVSAGGVETAEQLAYLQSHDCHSAQGYIFSPPVPADKFEELLHSGSWSRHNRPLGEDLKMLH